MSFAKLSLAPSRRPSWVRFAVSLEAFPRLLASRVRARERPLLVFESLLLKGAVGFLCLFPALIFGASVSNIAEQFVLFAGAITAAAVVWAKVIRPLIQGVNKLNDAYQAALKAEIEIRGIKQDLDEIKESLNGRS